MSRAKGYNIPDFLRAVIRAGYFLPNLKGTFLSPAMVADQHKC